METLENLRERLKTLEQEAALARAEAQAAECRFRIVADAAPLMIWLSGPDGGCTFVSKTWLEYRGRRLEDELGEGWTEGIHPEDRDASMSRYLDALRERREFRMEYRLLRADGRYCWVVDTGIPRFEPDGEFAGYVGSSVERPAPPENGSGGGVKAQGETKPLTPRELQVLRLIAEGKSTKAVAAALGISYKTADSHRTKIMEKLKVHETPSMVRYAIRIGLIEP